MTFEVLSPELYILGVGSVVSSGQNHRTPPRSFVPWRDCSLLCGYLRTANQGVSMTS